MTDRDPATLDWFHRHPHVTTLAAAALVGFIVAVVAFDGSSIVIGAAVITAVIAGLAEVGSELMQFPLVPSLLTGRDGLGNHEWIDPGGIDFADVGGGGGDGGGGG